MRSVEWFGLPLLAAALLVAPGAADAQIPDALSFEVRGGFGFPTGDLEDGTETGAGFGGDVYWAFHRMFSAYGGWSWMEWDCDHPDCGPDESVSTSGFDLGVKVLFDQGWRAIPWARGGLVFHDLEDSDGDDIDGDAGFELGVGVDWPIGEVLSFVPSLRYTSYGLDEDVVGDFGVSWVTLDLGLHVHF